MKKLLLLLILTLSIPTISAHAIIISLCDAVVSGTIADSDCSTGLFSATTNGGDVIPPDYSLIYLLTEGPEQIIIGTSYDGDFSIEAMQEENHSIHAAVLPDEYDIMSVFNLTVIELGQSFAETDLCAAIDFGGVTCADACLADAGTLNQMPIACQNQPFFITSDGITLNGPDAEYANAFLLLEASPNFTIVETSFDGVFNVNLSGDYQIMAVSVLAEELPVMWAETIGLDASLISTVVECFDFDLGPVFTIYSDETLCPEYGFQANAVAFYDENNNGLFESGEVPLGNQAFYVEPENAYSYTNSSGSTTVLLSNDSDYTLTWITDALWTLNGSPSVDFSTGPSSFDSTFYFPMNPIGVFVDQDLDLSSGITRCNWEVNYWLTYKNTGTTINSGWVQLIPDPETTFIEASVMPDSTAGDTLYWFYEDLLYSNAKLILLRFQMPSVDLIGESMDFEANMETWEETGSVKTSLSSELICAYDPNDKLVSPSLYGGDAKNYTLFEDSLEYTVRFQNTGNDTAFNVQILDEIDGNLDLNTFRVISSSHEVQTSLNSENRIATFLFENIYLPDSGKNEPASHGFVKYRIRANENLAEETIINNTAEIYFDLNPPIITNTVANTMVSVLPNLPVITASPTHVEFGYVELGQTGTQTISIQNPGDLSLEISEILSESNVFIIANEPVTVEGGGEVLIPVNFYPFEEIAYSSNLILRSNVGDLVVNVSGFGGIDTGINDLKWQFSVSPNPSNGLFNLNYTGESLLQNAALQIYDLSGRVVYAEKMNGNTSQIDLSNETQGIYYLHLQSENETIIKKLLIQ